MRRACDTGGTFTDLIVEYENGTMKMFKSATVPSDPTCGVLDAAQIAALDSSLRLSDFLARCEILVHGTTHAINAVITGNTAKTALLVTAGHPDILSLREGGRAEPFNFRVAYPQPYIPRALTFEVEERIDSRGEVVIPLNEGQLVTQLKKIAAAKVEAVAVCLLWAISNPAHEKRVGELIKECLPGVPFTLAHELNPTLREYRRASSAAIDASLKPMMSKYLGGLTSRLRDSGFTGRVLVLTSQGGMMDAEELARQPIHSLNSGPSMAPIAGKFYSSLDSDLPVAIVADTGGTTYDVSVVRRGRIPKTRETWLGSPYRGHMTGFPAIDIKSIGAGGGSIAAVDRGGMLTVGPRSAGSVPGPICYGSGGTEPTLTDACLVLGYIDPNFFLGGKKRLDRQKAEAAIADKIAKKLNVSTHEAAISIVEVATENMVQAIEEITVNQGIDPAQASLIGGGGAAGFNSVFIARRLGCPVLVVPETGAALSAAGALMSELRNEYREMFFARSGRFDFEAVNAVLTKLRGKCDDFLSESGVSEGRIEFAVEARYASQVWEIEVQLRRGKFSNEKDLREFIDDFHTQHQELFAVRDEGSEIEFVGWTAVASVGPDNKSIGRLSNISGLKRDRGSRKAYFRDTGLVDTEVVQLTALDVGKTFQGPAIVETPFTTIVVDPRAQYSLTSTGSLLVNP
jgi:N-methylhydantoinase A